MNKTKVVVFDFDDTLYSGADWTPWEEFCKVGLRKMFEELSDEEFKEIEKKYYSDGATDESIAGIMLAEGRDPKKWLKYREENVCEIDYSNCKVTSNATLKAFANRYTLYIVSNSTIKEIEETIELFNINKKYFKAIYSNQFESELPTKRKLYGKIIEREKIKPDELFVIGNSYKKDVLPALEMGAKGKVISEADFELEDFEELN